MSPLAPLLLLAIAAGPFLIAWKSGWRGAAWIVLTPAALLALLWAALYFYWIDHTGDDDAETILALLLIWFILAGGGAFAGLGLRRLRA